MLSVLPYRVIMLKHKTLNRGKYEKLWLPLFQQNHRTGRIHTNESAIPIMNTPKTSVPIKTHYSNTAQ